MVLNGECILNECLVNICETFEETAGFLSDKSQQKEEIVIKRKNLKM